MGVGIVAGIVSVIPIVGGAIGAGIAGGAAGAAGEDLADPEQKEAVKIHGKVTSAQYIENCIKAKGYEIVPDKEFKKEE